MSGHVFCTVVTRSHLRYAVALGRQLKRFHPEATLEVLLIDPPVDLRPFAHLPVSLIPLSELKIPNIESMKIYFTAFELSNALKPFIINYLLDHRFRRVVYLDSDVFVVGSFHKVLSFLETSNFVLTPHVLTPSLDNSGLPTNVMIADSGIYNGGMLAVAEHGNARAALKWLMDVLPEAGFADPSRGMFVDQKLLPLAAELFHEGFGVFRNQGYNVAYWNLQERNVRKDGPLYFVGDEPVTFFHLSGFREERPDRFSILSDRHTFTTVPVTADIIAEYLETIPTEACLQISGYAFDWYRGGRLTTPRRRYYFQKGHFPGYRMSRICNGASLIARGLWRAVT